jgi:integrase
LLGLYTGARVSELAQLRTDDVDLSSTLAMLSITDEAEGQTVKTQAGIRLVPVHSELVRLGFLEYVGSVVPQGGPWFWPSLPIRQGKPGGYFSQWFGEYRKALGFGKYPDFHCMRHTVRTQMADA